MIVQTSYARQMCNTLTFFFLSSILIPTTRTVFLSHLGKRSEPMIHTDRILELIALMHHRGGQHDGSTAVACAGALQERRPSFSMKLRGGMNRRFDSEEDELTNFLVLLRVTSERGTGGAVARRQGHHGGPSGRACGQVCGEAGEEDGGAGGLAPSGWRQAHA
eukprot:306677-Rhodomonas_salina.2